MTDQPATLPEALAALQAALPRVAKDTDAQYGKYADLTAVSAAILPLLGALGLYWSCRPTLRDDGQFVLRYELGHTSGAMITGDYPLSQGSPQTLGSAITYARRYALCAVTGLAPGGDDDDAQAAQADKGSSWAPPANPRTRKADRHHAARNGRLADDEWTTPPDGEAPEDRPGSVTDAQARRMMALFAAAGARQREDRMALTNEILNPEVPVTSSRELSFRQAEELCRKLESLAGQGA